MKLEIYEDNDGSIHIVEKAPDGAVTYWHDYRSDSKGVGSDVIAWMRGSDCSGWGGNQKKRLEAQIDIRKCRLLGRVTRVGSE